MAKVRLGFSSVSTDSLAEQLGRWQGESWTKGVCGDAPGSGSRRRLRPREGQEELQDAGDLASLPCLALGTPSAVPHPKGCPGLTSESLARGQWGREVKHLARGSLRRELKEALVETPHWGTPRAP